MALQACILIHKNVPQETIQLYHLNLNIISVCVISQNLWNNEKNQNSCFESYDI